LVLDRARHLSTKSTPRIYYRPYLLTTDHKALIEDQVSQAQAQIDANEEGTTLRPKRESSPQRTRSEQEQPTTAGEEEEEKVEEEEAEDTNEERRDEQHDEEKVTTTG
jgi:hypothetical protein